ncbi:hypothetical protein CB1_000839023 [Camelus ferus]|nr:hypothetical protein CB1_000839023 [Camelus ferus]
MSSGTMKFNGYLRVRIGEAVGLQPTRWSLRHSLFKKGHQLLDPYLTVSVDQVRVGQTSTKQKTNKPTYNEEFCANVTDGGHLELAVFHETPLGYDHFVANCTLQFQELLRTAGASDTFEGWNKSFICEASSICSNVQHSLGFGCSEAVVSSWAMRQLHGFCISLLGLLTSCTSGAWAVVVLICWGAALADVWG